MIKNNTTLKVRLNATDKLLFKYLCAKCNKTESEYMRMLIDKSILGLKVKIQRGELTYENVQTFFDNQLQLSDIFGNKIKSISRNGNT